MVPMSGYSMRIVFKTITILIPTPQVILAMVLLAQPDMQTQFQFCYVVQIRTPQVSDKIDPRI